MKQIERLYREYKQDVYHYVLSLTNNPSLADDLLSETFISAIKSIHRFKGQSSLKTWLCSIARHKWLDHLKRQKASVEYNDLLQLYVATSIEGHMITAELAEYVLVLLQEKDERTRAVIGMRVEGYSYAEIAERQGISESSARVIDFRTKKWLKERLAKEDWL
ncbi:RNA polymerase sigma factor [Paenibacillus sp. 1011MAR3C5]|uniref:RNA polymerase sigma factor n=1 Tax=Paenibacillus sp. 1011MAR3C5 TaxID=1675787 RepID=UPI000E6CFC35|nr:RNA polymerase sigma factor [Paenibacillus sp. 1011MAR3C5]RJE83327.1 RNA polymerase sigma factor [Paenibacillus sp. 1011MAR3C5]